MKVSTFSRNPMKYISTFEKPTEYPPVPPHVNCEADWFYMESSGNCYHIDHTMISSFDAAESKCVGMGGHLASINSPDIQAEIRLHLNDPGAIGKSLIDYKRRLSRA